jgi:hypothetical protein
MKIAVLISGEYRTFDVAVKSMSFLHQPNVDVYFSTWDRSKQKNDILGIALDEEVTYFRIAKALGDKKLTDFCIDDHTYLADKLYNTKMIYKWHRGLEMIQRSGIEYDLIMITRPDLWFDLNCWNSFKTLDDFAEIDTSVLYSHFVHPIEKRIGMEDMTYIAKTDAMYEAILGCKSENWIADFEAGLVYDWHRWLLKDYSTRNIDVQNARPTISISHCRPNCDLNDDTFEKIMFKSRIWRYELITEGFRVDRAASLLTHGELIEQEMKNFFASSEYKNFILRNKLRELFKKSN